jgi:serine protease inhibitor
LHRALRDFIGDGQGVAWSPFSVWCSLSMAAIGDQGVSMSNTAWIQDTFEIEADYRSAIKLWAAGDVRSIDFEASPESARRIINDEVADKTHDLIRDLIDAEAIDELTVLVLVNALYAHADWSESFNPRETTEAPFHSPEGPLPVAMMHSRLKGSFAASGGWQAVGLPCRGDHLGAAWSRRRSQ